jgi:hypothetical protein
VSSTIDATEPTGRLEERFAQAADFQARQLRRLARRLRRRRGRPGYHARLIAATAAMTTCSALLSDLHQREQARSIRRRLKAKGLAE